MKKIFGLIALVAVGAVGWFGYQYYTNTYVGVEGYAVVPQEVPEKIETKDNQGKAVTDTDGTPLYSYEYNNITFVTKDGKKQQNSFDVTSTNPQPLQPGTYLKAKVSKNRVVEGPNSVNEGDVPQNVKDLLK